MVIDSGDGKDYLDKPGNVYIATERLKILFDGVPDVMIVDDAYSCLRGEEVRELMEACGAVRCPRPLEAPNSLSDQQRQELRRKAGHEQTSNYSDTVVDWSLQGFDKLIALLPTLSPEQRLERARLLWDSLGDLEERRGRGIFEGSYRWTHNGRYDIQFPSAFIRHLNDVPWVPVANGELRSPGHVTFDSLDWKPNPFLLSKIQFKPPIIDQLAREAGIDPAALDLLRQYGITSAEELRARLGISDVSSEENKLQKAEATPEQGSPSSGDVYDEAKDLYGDDMPEIPPGTPDPDGGDVPRGSGGGSSGGKGDNPGAIPLGVGGSGHSSSNSRHRGASSGAAETTTNSPGNGQRQFISYVATSPNDEEGDAVGLDHAARMLVEEQAIKRILQREPVLKRSPEGNPGYDLYESDASGNPVRWVEVKSMTGSLEDRPVGLSHTQFDLASVKRERYWLYVVEHANDPERFRLLRIQDPAGQVRTYTFDNGWSEIAEK
jgi:hypothetical protein